MKPFVQTIGVMLLLAVAGICAQAGAAKPSKPPKPPPARNEARSGAAKNPPPAAKNPPPAAKNPPDQKPPGAPKLSSPGNPVERLMAMPPEKREQVLEKLPPQQQANLRQRLEKYDKLPAAERVRLNQMWNTFNSLPPEKQAVVTRQMQAFNNLPEERRQELRPVLQRLRTMPEDWRNTLLNSEAFRSRYSPSELEMLTDISQYYPLPER